MKPEKLTFKQFKSIYSRVPRLTVDVVLKTPKGVLLSRRDIPPAKGMWHLPGGTILYGETHKQAVERVAQEEMGIIVKIEKQLGVIEYGRKYSIGQTTAIVYQVSKVSGNLKGSWQANQLKFFKKLPKNVIPEPEKFIKRMSLI